MAKDLISIDKKKYRNDSLSYALSLLGLLFNALYFITLYKNNNNFYYSYLMGISIIYNLLFMLLVFLAAEEVKIYQRNFSFLLLFFAIMQIFRIFYYPKLAFKADVLSLETYRLIIIYLVISSLFLIASAILSFRNSTILKRYVEGKLVTSHE